MSDKTSPGSSPIAVVGVSALFPGSLDATGFWSDILAGSDLITDVPETHWRIEDYYDPDPSVPDKTYARRGAFLSDVDFDAMGWGVPPNIVPETDTSQLLALIVAQKVLEDAAKGAPETLDRSRTSVILGVTSGQELLGSMVSRLQRPVWTKALREAGLPESEVEDICQRISSHYTDWNESTFPGLLGNVVAGRIANRLDLGGTNCVCDAACASTMSALSMAISELRLGESDMVIAGGVDTMNDIFMFMCFSKTPALSMSGDCRPFSAEADGTMLGEGLGMVALKRLEDAERDGDRIYAVIRGCGSSSDGRSKSVYAPVSEGQAEALRRAYRQAGHGPETVELIEAHGTGTRAGDAAEFGGLSMVFEETGREDRQWCQLGSVKSQIGHTKSAAGAAGLFKAVMALHHRVLPPTIKIDRPNPALDLPASPFHLTTRSRPWVRDSNHPRRASVSSFGFGGSNFHVALEEYRPTADGPRTAPRLRANPAELVVLNADSATDLAQQARELAAEIESVPGNHLPWQAYRSQADASTSHRLALVARDDDDLASKLEQAAGLIDRQGDQPFATPQGLAYGIGQPDGDVAFLFPGQGSQYVDMGAPLAMHFDAALAPWDLAANLDLGSESALHEVVFPITSFEEGADEAANRRLAATQWAQPAIGCTSLSQLALLEALGLQPAYLAGHSFGEVTALHAAGVLDAQQFLQVARRRGELMAEAASEPGAMTAVNLPLEDLQPKLDAWGSTVVMANHNTPEQVVLSGRTGAIEAVEARLAEDGVKTRRLPVDTAFHSELVADASTGLANFLGDLDFSTAQFPVFANSTAAPYPAETGATRQQLADQLALPVRFVEMVDALAEAGARTFVEVGPGSVLSGLVGRILGDRPHRTVRLDRKKRDGVQTFLEGLATLVADGHALDLSALWQGYATPRNPADLPRPKLSIPINGANYGKPYPAPGDAAKMPPPNPERPPQEAPSAPVAAANAPSASAAPSEPATSTPAPVPAQPTTAPTATAALPPRSSMAAAPTTAPSVAPPVATAPASAPGWTLAWQETQRQTAEAHSVYMDAMARSHTAFLQTIEQGFGAMTGQGVPTPAMAAQPTAVQPMSPQPATIQPVAPVQPQPVAQPSVPAQATQPQAASQAQPVVTPSVATLQPSTPEPANTAPPSAPKPAQAASAPVEPAAPAPVVATPAPAAPSVDLHAVMLQVVSDKTGYPPEMLSMDMQLEGDLGIDSIKRVEILSAVQEQAPGLPEVDTTVLAKLQTLGEIVDHMQSLLGDAPAPAVATPAVAAPAPAAPSVDLHALMLQVVADKTGYPPEMLSMDMQLEGDLGIDSIKRVEILSAVQDQAPGLPEVDTTVLAKLQNLGEIVDHMQSLLGDAPAPAVASTAAATPPAAAPSVDLHAVMLQTVADKTGYPPEMLSMDMQLEGDLGIDSIKRVEILSAVQDQALGLPEVDTTVLAKLQTLGEIVDHMSSSLGATAAAPATTAASATTAGPAAASVAAAPAPATPGVDLQAVMLQTVADKTGYPSEMLSMDMQLEGDLGIDSIKRVEILSAVQDQAPELPEVDTTVLAKLQTLGEIVDHMQGSLGGAAPTTDAGVGTPAAEAAIAEASATTPSNLGRFVLTCEEQPAPGLALSGLLGGGRIVVSSEGGALAETVATLLRQRGVTAEAVADLDQAAAQGPLAGLIFLGGLRLTDSVDEAVAINREGFAAAKTFVASHGGDGKGLFVTVQDTGGTFGCEPSDGDSVRAWSAGLAGLARSVAQEWPEVSVKAIDLARGERDTAALANALVDELFLGGPTLEVGLPADGRRLRLTSPPVEVASPDRFRDETVLTDGDLVVASGGARGVTATTLIELAGQAALRFVLLGRTALADEPAELAGIAGEVELKRELLQQALGRGEKPSPAELGRTVRGILGGREIRQTLRDIEAQGSEARYLAVDVTDTTALASALDALRSEWGPVRGVVHGAGVIHDKLLAEKTQEQFDRVFDTKVDGLRALLSATADDPLKVLCLFSSVAARCGNIGQSDYAMANEVLNKVAWAEARRRGSDCRVKSLGWGPWEGGMVSPQLKTHFESLGVPLIPLPVGAKMLVDELVSPQIDQVEMVLGGEPRPEALAPRGGTPTLTVEVMVDRESYPYLRDHSIKGTPVIPVALVIEWLSRAARAFKPGLLLAGIEDVKVLRGLPFEDFEHGRQRLQVHAGLVSNTDGAVVALELRDDAGKPCYRATATMVAAPRQPSQGDTATSAITKATELDLETWGDRPVYDGEVLFHGPDFQMIRSIDGISDHGMTAEMGGVVDAGWAAPWCTDPLAVDGGLQLAVLWCQRMLGGGSLPTAIEALRLFTDQPIHGPLRGTLTGRVAKGSRSVSDVVFQDADGVVVAELRGIETHLLPKA